MLGVKVSFLNKGGRGLWTGLWTSGRRVPHVWKQLGGRGEGAGLIRMELSCPRVRRGGEWGALSRGKEVLTPKVVPSLAHVCQRIPRPVLEATYGISILRPREDEDPDRTPTSEELLSALGCE